MGKLSTSAILEELFKDKIENILLKHFKGVKTNADAVEKMHKITKGAVKVSHVTIQKMVYLAHANKLISPDDFPFAYVDVPAKTGHRGKISIREILEKKKGKSFWDIIAPYKTMTKEDTAKALGVNYASVLNTIRRAVEKGEEFNGAKISESDFPRWFKQKKIKPGKENTTSEIQEVQEDMFKVKAVCSECGHSKGWYERPSVAGPNINVGLKATRCPQCHKWQTYEATVEVNGIKIIKKVIPHGPDAMLYEDFVDKNGSQIKNPLLIPA
ncbi:MAG: hypothetical protein UT06_C0051G0002 [Candidatus Woesebacteria bacterium GW2011_GWA1_38_8]|uniref:Uncharacterized protein n=1 Tax=Candidatus Woesebacteria bacterium GW2011_GWA1_38_8 TaxID=1618547 RepID=A0A0G0NY88_9BACT|nr:MAG: hypothetical protein UT06_C0051G0002 [Candidatus Woesebacteria bacterium GW2011_GWA1_38_8]